MLLFYLFIFLFICVDAEFVVRQKKVLSFFKHVEHFDHEEEWYKIGKEFDIEANIENYTDKKAVKEFLYLYKTGFLPKNKVFSIFDEKMKEEAVALFNIFYYAKNFETFYNTAAFARVYLNEYMFTYTFYIAVFQREDTKGYAVPAPYEVYPEFFTNSETMFRVYHVKMEDGVYDEKLATLNGIVKEKENYYFYANYSNYWTYGNEEQRLAYFTEDVGLNAYYYYFHSYFPFWMKGNMQSAFKERRGEIWFYFYKQLLARYYLERLSNGLGEIPDFDWHQPIKTGYIPLMVTLYYPFIQRSDNYRIPTYKFNEELQLIDTYEKTYNQEIDTSKSINFVANFWQSNSDLLENTERKNYNRSYETLARHLLSAAPENPKKDAIVPSALMFYQTSLRDPVFYQLYRKIMKYVLEYKKYLEPYSQDQLHFVGVKINDVHVDKLVTFNDLFEYDITNGVYLSKEEIKNSNTRYLVRQQRLNHKDFTVTVDVKSDVETEAIFKIFIGPKYYSNGFPIGIENNWMNFVELDWFKQKLTAGQNKIERKSDDFYFYKDDSVPMTEVYKYLEQGKLSKDMSEDFRFMPSRLMLPKGQKGGFPYQIFVMVYPATSKNNAFPEGKVELLDNKPLSYPFDRPVNNKYNFKQNNMIFKEVLVYFEGEHYPF